MHCYHPDDWGDPFDLEPSPWRMLLVVLFCLALLIAACYYFSQP